MESDNSNSEEENLSLITTELKERCDKNGLILETRHSEITGNLFNIGFKNGKDTTWELYRGVEKVQRLLSIEFEQYIFVSNFLAIWSHKNGTIELAVRPADGIGTSQIYRRVLGFNALSPQEYISTRQIVLEAPEPELPTIKLGVASDDFYKMVIKSLVIRPITILLENVHVTSPDSATKIVIKLANFLLFQIELTTDIPLIIERRRNINKINRRVISKWNLIKTLQYPKTEYDEVPIALYWYGRSAIGTPLIQFLAFYQVFEYHYPTYSRKEARRKIRSILKDPTFRYDREVDIGKLLSIIESRRGVGSTRESAQLKDVLEECVEEQALREFFQQNQDRRKFFEKKSLSKYKISPTSVISDLKQAVAERIYDIRCRIVHTKVDFNEEDSALLPNSREASELGYDIDLVRYVAQCVLKDAGFPLSV